MLPKMPLSKITATNCVYPETSNASVKKKCFPEDKQVLSGTNRFSQGTKRVTQGTKRVTRGTIRLSPDDFIPTIIIRPGSVISNELFCILSVAL